MENLDQIVSRAQSEFAADRRPGTTREQAKAQYLGKSGALTELLKGLGKLPPEERRVPARRSTPPSRLSRRRWRHGAPR
jgi:phenylalanyl-tRNA synthetase alpha chain